MKYRVHEDARNVVVICEIKLFQNYYYYSYYSETDGYITHNSRTNCLQHCCNDSGDIKIIRVVSSEISRNLF